MTLTAKSRSFSIAYEDVGTGSPVVLVPGFMQCAADWREYGYVDELAKSSRVLIVDPLGHGMSDKPSEWEAYTRPEVAADIVAVLNDAAVDRAVMWGFSRGAELAHMVALEFPDRVRALILGSGLLTADSSPAPAELPPYIAPLRAGDWAGFWLFLPMKEEYQRDMQAVNDPRALAALIEAGVRARYLPESTRVSIPSMVYIGESEGAPDAIEQYADRVRADLGARLIVLEGCDHAAVFVESERVIADAMAFIRSLDS